MTQEQKDKISAATSEMEARSLPVVWEVLRLLVEKKPKILDLTPEERHAEYAPLAEQVLSTMKECGIIYSEKQYPFAFAHNVVEELSQVVLNALKISYEKSCAKQWGKDMYEVTLADIDAVLKGEVSPEVPTATA